MGGGTIRTAAKVAGIAATTGGFRGIAAEHSPISSAARMAGSAFSAAATATAEDVKLAASKLEDGVQRSSLVGIDDWVFAGGEEEEAAAVVTAGEPMSRVVFGGAPSLQEAKEATSELTVALEKAYLSPPNSEGHEGSVDYSSQSLLNKDIGDVEGCVTSDIATAPAVPAPAIMAFRFLHESTMAQNVVASIASDANVWNAVLQNKELQDFLHSQRAGSFSNKNFNVELVANSEFLDRSFTKSVGDSSEPGSGFMDFLQKIKCTVMDMMRNLSGYFQNFFGGKGVNGVFVNSDGTAKLSGESFMESSFMGLAVMAILLILLKRA